MGGGCQGGEVVDGAESGEFEAACGGDTEEVEGGLGGEEVSLGGRGYCLRWTCLIEGTAIDKDEGFLPFSPGADMEVSILRSQVLRPSIKGNEKEQKR